MRRLYEWWLWRRAQRCIDAAFPGAVVVRDSRWHMPHPILYRRAYKAIPGRTTQERSDALNRFIDGFDER